MTSIRKKAKRKLAGSGVVPGKVPNDSIVRYGFKIDCSKVAHPPTVQNVRRIAGAGVVEQDHIKVLAANVMYRNMLLMGDL